MVFASSVQLSEAAVNGDSGYYLRLPPIDAAFIANVAGTATGDIASAGQSRSVSNVERSQTTPPGVLKKAGDSLAFQITSWVFDVLSHDPSPKQIVSIVVMGVFLAGSLVVKRLRVHRRQRQKRPEDRHKCPEKEPAKEVRVEVNVDGSEGKFVKIVVVSKAAHELGTVKSCRSR